MRQVQRSSILRDGGHNGVSHQRDRVPPYHAADGDHLPHPSHGHRVCVPRTPTQQTHVINVAVLHIDCMHTL